MQVAHTDLIASNERLQREVYTKKQLLVSVGDSNSLQVNRLKAEYVALEKHQSEKFEGMGM